MSAGLVQEGFGHSALVEVERATHSLLVALPDAVVVEQLQGAAPDFVDEVHEVDPNQCHAVLPQYLLRVCVEQGILGGVAVHAHAEYHATNGEVAGVLDRPELGEVHVVQLGELLHVLVDDGRSAVEPILTVANLVVEVLEPALHVSAFIGNDLVDQSHGFSFRVGASNWICILYQNLVKSQ